MPLGGAKCSHLLKSSERRKSTRTRYTHEVHGMKIEKKGKCAQFAETVRIYAGSDKKVGYRLKSLSY